MISIPFLVAVLVIVQVLTAFIGPAAGSDRGFRGQKADDSVLFYEFLSLGLPGVPKQDVSVKNIPPLYTEPLMPKEGVWTREDVSGGPDAASLVYRTFYRPS
jgi:hypothetical protein